MQSGITGVNHNSTCIKAESGYGGVEVIIVIISPGSSRPNG